MAHLDACFRQPQEEAGDARIGGELQHGEGLPLPHREGRYSIQDTEVHRPATGGVVGTIEGSP